jgi:carbonic anhydrase
MEDCGTLSFKDETIRKRLPGRDDINGMSFGAITEYASLFPGSLCPLTEIDGSANTVHGSLEQSVRDDIAVAKTSPFIRKELADRLFGYVYDLETGRLTEVNP